MRRREFLAAATLPLWARPAHAAATSKVVTGLRKISLERRAALAANADKRTVAQLNASIPEIDEIEVVNGVSPERSEGIPSNPNQPIPSPPSGPTLRRR